MSATQRTGGGGCNLAAGAVRHGEQDLGGVTSAAQSDGISGCKTVAILLVSTDESSEWYR